MRISRVHIENYRSIKSLDFDPGSYCVLIGENNSGKSNILRALNLALGETWPSERSFSESDFHLEITAEPIVIQVFFDQILERWANNFKVEIAGIELRCKAYKKRVGTKPAGSLKVEYKCIRDNGEAATYPEDTLVKGQSFKGRWLDLRVSSDLREQLPFIYVDVLREYDRQNPGSRWSVLRRLFNEVNTEFLNDKTVITLFDVEGNPQKLTRKQAFEATVKEAYKYLRTDSYNEIEKRLAANAIEQMGLEAGENKIDLSFESHDPTNAFKSLQLYVEQQGFRCAAGEVGAGLQSAIVIAIFRTYEELKKEGAIFAIEEPEVFLHPQKARYFASILRSLSEKGNQVFTTTHSPVFVQIDDPESVAVVRRTEATGTIVKQAKKVEIAPTERKQLRLQSEFDSQRNELFFARKVMLVEGNTEKLSVPILFKTYGIDINKENISIVECGSKTQISFFARIAKAFEIPCTILADEDIFDPKLETDPQKAEHRNQANESSAKTNEDLIALAGEDNVFFLRPDFESEMGLPDGKKTKVDQAVAATSTMRQEVMPTTLKNAIMTVAKS